MPRKNDPAYKTENSVFATRLREIMKERGENQTTLADKITSQYVTIQRQTISLYMNGQSRPDTERLTAISKVLDVSADWLLGISNTQTQDIRVQQICKFTGLSEDLVVFLMEKQGEITPKVLDGGLLPPRIVGPTHPSVQACALNKFLPPDQLLNFSYALSGFSSEIEWLKMRAEFYRAELNDAMTNWDEYKFSYLRNECTEQYESIRGKFRFKRFSTIEMLAKMLDDFLEREGIPTQIDSVLGVMSETLRAVEEYIESQ